MALLDDLAKGTADYIGKRLYGMGRDQEYSVVEKFGNYTPHKNFLDSYEGIVYACISAISEEVGNYKPLLHKPKGDELVGVKQHKLLELLDNPQPDEPAGISTYELFEATQSFIELTGECFWYKVLGDLTKKPKAIYILRPDRMGIDVDDNGNINGYFLRRGAGDPIPFEVAEIEHFKMFNPKNPYRGYGTIEASSDYIATERNTSKFTSNFFGNNAGLSGVLSVKGEVTKNAFKKFVTQWREKYQGVDNAGKVAILRESDAVFTKVGLGLNELDMTALRKMTIDEVLMMFRVPRSMIGLSDESGLGRASVETLEYIFTKRVVNPKMKRIDSVIQRMADRHWRDENLVVSHDDIVPRDKEFELKERQAGVDVWLTRNEIRDAEGLDEQDGGDELRAPLSSYPITDTVSSGADKSAKKKTLVLTLKKKAVDPEPEPEPTEAEKEQTDYVHKESFRLSLMKVQEAYERKLNSKLRSILEEQRKQVLGKVNPKSIKKELSSLLFSLSEANGIFEQELYPILQECYMESGALALIFAGDEESVFKISDAQKIAVTDNLKRMAKNYNEETIEKLTATLSAGLQEGESLSKLAKRVTTVYEEAKGYRAKRVAQTESLKASNNATNFAYKQTGYVKSMKWFANPSHCGYCSTLDGKEVGLDDNFANLGEQIKDADSDAVYVLDYENIKTPPVHPNCKCTIVPVR